MEGFAAGLSQIHLFSVLPILLDRSHHSVLRVMRLMFDHGLYSDRYISPRIKDGMESDDIQGPFSVQRKSIETAVGHAQMCVLDEALSPSYKIGYTACLNLGTLVQSLPPQVKIWNWNSLMRISWR
jgi:hypothetical protein